MVVLSLSAPNLSTAFLAAKKLISKNTPRSLRSFALDTRWTRPTYLSKHGASSNAYTETEYTCYHFEVKRVFLKGALKSPLSNLLVKVNELYDHEVTFRNTTVSSRQGSTINPWDIYSNWCHSNGRNTFFVKGLTFTKLQWIAGSES
ncbi:hypothetical protein VNO80_20901 [Phaseolus coccineus]|uniref:Peptidase M16 N-terminal domain-containing protein n=1 Tax=Phaseolus coccineus TaxID=3886 RepID=A0AAN9QX72_PHACN